MDRLKKFVKKNRSILIIVSLALALRLIFLSPWLEDWDSVQFALALKEFSTVKHQPHPPGYILYIFSAKGLNILLRNDTLSLTLISAILGSISIFPFYLIVKEFVKQKTALLSSTLMAITPVHWILSEAALSNVPGLFFGLTSVYFLLKGKHSNKHLVFGSLLSGLTIGVRFSEYSTVIVVLLLVLIYKKSLHDLFKSFTLFLLGILIWFLPLSLLTGINQLFNTYSRHALYIISHDSMLSNSQDIIKRFILFGNLFHTGFTYYFIPLLTIPFIYLAKNKDKIKKFPLVLAVCWLLSYLIPLLFLYNLEDSLKYALPLLPPMILFIALSLEKLSKQKLLLYCFAFFTLVIFAISLSKVYSFKNLTPPSISPILYVKREFNPKETTLITSFTFRHFQYYAPGYKNYRGMENTPGQIEDKFIITDHITLKQKLHALSDYRLIAEKEFSGPSDIFPRVSKTNIYVFQKN